MSNQYLYAAKTDIGAVRQSNQDACNVFCPEEDACFAVVCDGMGGYNGGEIASALAVETICRRVRDGWRKGMSEDSVRNLLLTSVTAANVLVYDAAHEKPEFAGMGTTVIAAAVLGERIVIAHAGDSRAYLCGEAPVRVTKDHSYVQALLDAGMITESDADRHPEKNVITRALGVREQIELTFTCAVLKKNEKLLLCSDGLTNYVPEDEICGILNSNPPAEACDALIAAANANGGGDNITAAVVCFR